MAVRWLVTGASGQLGGHVVRQLCAVQDAEAVLALAGRQAREITGVQTASLELADVDAVRACVAGYRPTHVLHIGGMTAVSDCCARPAEAERVNVEGTRALVDAAAECGARLVYTSTDMVFGGDAAPYHETDAPAPLSHYGRTKAAAEGLTCERARTLVVRLPLMYGLPVWPRATTFASQMNALRAGTPLRLFTDEFRTPLALSDAARAVIGLGRSDLTGVIHVAGPERLSRFELVRRCAAELGLVVVTGSTAGSAATTGAGVANLVAISRHDVPAAEPRPADLSLACSFFNAAFPELRAGPVRREVLES